MGRLFSSTVFVIASLSPLVVMGGCSSITSKVDKGSQVGDGIVYYMPRRPIKIVVTIPKKAEADAGTPEAAAPPADEGKGKSKAKAKDGAAGTEDATTVTAPPAPAVIQAVVEKADAIPDLTQRFTLGYDQNFIGKNHSNIAVSTSGLLTTSNADTTSGLATIAQNLGKAIASAQVMAAVPPGADLPAKVAPECLPGRTYTKLIFPEEEAGPITICKFKVTWTAIDGKVFAPDEAKRANSRNPQSTARLGTAAGQSGIFYKQDIPYRVTIQDPDDGPSSDFMAYSPDLSPVMFLPVTRTLFANNQTNITLVEGTVTSVDASADGELVALTELPADFVTAYATAVGSLFSAFGTDTQNKTTLINNQQALAVATVQKEACAATMAASKAALDPSNLTGKTGEDLAAAVANINAALANVRSACPAK